MVFGQAFKENPADFNIFITDNAINFDSTGCPALCGFKYNLEICSSI